MKKALVVVVLVTLAFVSTGWCQEPMGKEKVTLDGHTKGVAYVRLSADEKRLLSASRDGTIKVWNVESDKETLALRGHTDSVLGLAPSADGKRLFSASVDKTIKGWDLETGKETV